MNVLGVLLLLVAVPPPADRVKLLPVPTSAELAKAERTIKEVFGDDLKRARKPADKAALARKMIATAEGSDPAERYALLVRARELAIDAKDPAAGVQAVEGLAGFAGPSDAAEGHRLWNEARGLSGKLEAAECYLRALPGLTGFQRGVVEGRLRELGWPAKRFLLPQQVVDLFGIPGARIEGDAVRWKDTSGAEALWMQRPTGQQPLEFGFEIQAKENHSIRTAIDGDGYVLCVGHYSNTCTLFATNAGGAATFQRVASTRVDSPDKWHALVVRLEERKVRFFYDDKLIHEVNQEPGVGPESKIRLGFGDHRTDVAIRRVFYRVEPSPPAPQQ